MQSFAAAKFSAEKKDAFKLGDLTFIDRERNWSFSKACAVLYKAKKGIELSAAASLDHEYQLGYSLDISLFQEIKKDPFFSRHWQYLFGPRIKACIEQRSTNLPKSFSGEPSVETFDRSSCISSFNALHYDRLFQLSPLKQRAGVRLVQFENLNLEVQWPWSYIEKPKLKQITIKKYGDPGSLPEEKDGRDNLKALVNLIQTKEENSTRIDIKNILSQVHSLWSSTIFSYSDKSLNIANKILLQELNSLDEKTLLALLFELEVFATHSTLTEDMQPVASGFFANSWLDIGSLELAKIRGTEQCQPDRLFEEIFNLRDGKIAPIAVNEFGCVADGNHRLTAAWIWNILSACQSYTWSIEDEAFQRRIAEYVSKSPLKSLSVSLHEALRYLAFFLSNSKYSEKLIRDFQKIKFIPQIKELPVIPILEYNSLTVMGDDYDKSRSCTPFPEHVYELIKSEPNAVLSPRACYHFADRIPMPWFAIVNIEEFSPQPHLYESLIDTFLNVDLKQGMAEGMAV